MTPRYLRLVATTLVVFVATVQGQTETTAMSYAVQFLTPDAVPVTGPIDVSVKFFAQSSEGRALLEPKQYNGLAVTHGVAQIQIELSDADWHTLFPLAGASRYVEFHDETNAVLAPRQRFGVMPYALKVPVDGTTLAWDPANGALGFAPSAAVGMAGQRLTELAAPASDSDAATKSYVDQAIASAAPSTSPAPRRPGPAGRA